MRHAPTTRNLPTRAAALLAASLLVVGACSSSSDDEAAGSAATTAPVATEDTEDTEDTEEVTIDELQVIGSHNSYHLAPQEEIGAVISAFAPDYWEQLDYSHLPLTEQLEEHGIRQLEIDVYADPDGGRYADRPAMVIIDQPTASGVPELDEPGFKVMHIQDFDFATTCVTFVACLEEVEAWSSAHPDHVPVMIMVETKSDSIEEGAAGLGVDVGALGIDWTEPIEMTPELFADLEAEVLEVFPREQIITPDDVRGDAATLDEAVRTTGWPTLASSRGKVLFSLVDTGADRDLYLEGAPALEGRLFFTSAEPGVADAAFVRIDDPVADADALAEALAAGYLVRTRSDVPTVDARTGDTSRRDAALASGAQYVSTDFYVERPEFGTGFSVGLPGDAVARCSPVTATDACTDDELAE